MFPTLIWHLNFKYHDSFFLCVSENNVYSQAFIHGLNYFLPVSMCYINFSYRYTEKNMLAGILKFVEMVIDKLLLNEVRHCRWFLAF